MTARSRRHPILTWAIAWGIMGMGLYLAGIGNGPRLVPTWISVVSGTLAWAWAGALTFHGELRFRGLLIWELTCAVAFGLAALWAWSYPGQGWGTLLVWSLGTTLGPLLSGGREVARRPGHLLALHAFQWGSTNAAGALVGKVGASLFGLLAVVASGSFGHEQLLVTLAVGLGAAMGGVLVGAVGLAAREQILGAPQNNLSRAGIALSETQ